MTDDDPTTVANSVTTVAQVVRMMPWDVPYMVRMMPWDVPYTHLWCLAPYQLFSSCLRSLAVPA